MIRSMILDNILKSVRRAIQICIHKHNFFWKNSNINKKDLYLFRADYDKHTSNS